MRFLHTADWQLGMTRRWLPAEAQARFADARLEAVREIGRLAEREQCDFVVVSGDVFEANQLSPQTVGRALEAISAIGVPVFLLPGNHDPYDSSSIYRSAAFTGACPEHVTVLTEPGVTQVGEHVDLVAAPWFSKHPDGDLVAAVTPNEPAPAGRIRILLGHGSVDLLEPDREKVGVIETASLEQALASGALHYVALGDRHSVTKVGDSGAIWYSGAPEVTSPREVDPGSVLVVQVSASGRPEVTRHRVGTWTFCTLEKEVSSRASVEALDRELASLPRKDRTVVRLVLRGGLSLADHALLTQVCHRHEAVLAGLHHWHRHSDVRVLAGADDIGALGLTGFVASAADEIRVLAGQEQPTTAAGVADEEGDPLRWSLPQWSDPDPSAAADALALLHRLVDEVER